MRRRYQHPSSHDPLKCTAHSSRFSPRLGTRWPWRRPTFRTRAGVAGTDPGKRHAGIREAACAMRDSPGGTRRRVPHPARRTIRDTAKPSSPGRHRGMPPVHGYSGDRHCPCGPGPANREGRGREHAGSGPLCDDDRGQALPMGATGRCNGTHGIASSPDSAVHLPRMRPCGVAERRAMSVPSARYQRYQSAERPPGGRKVPAASVTRGRSVSCMAFRVPRSRLLRSRITYDNCRYQP